MLPAKKTEYLTIAQAAELITWQSGHYTDRDTIYHDIKRKKPYTKNVKIDRASGGHVLPKSDVEEFSKVFKGKLKRGRPRKI